jgi:hypothetical protein
MFEGCTPEQKRIGMDRGAYRRKLKRRWTASYTELPSTSPSSQGDAGRLLVHRFENEIGNDSGKQTDAKHSLRFQLLISIERIIRTGPNRSSYGAPVLSRIARARIWYTVRAYNITARAGKLAKSFRLYGDIEAPMMVYIAALIFPTWTSALA